MKKRRSRPKPEPLLGSTAFGAHPEAAPTGSQAFGEPDADLPLRGALLFGNDPQGNPRGSEAFGGSEAHAPLKGALLFGNDPQGNPRGSEAFGGPEQKVPLKGALLFGNDPQGAPRGSEAVGTGDETLRFRGSDAFGAPQLVPDKLGKDDIGYDFGGVLLERDDSSLAGVRKGPRDKLRLRVVRALERFLALEVDHLRHGLGEDAIKWGRLRRDASLDRRLAETLRAAYRMAPGEVLGIEQVRDLMEEAERIHTFDLSCAWDTSPVTLSVLWEGEPVAQARWQIHKEHTFFVFEDLEGKLLGYADTLLPRLREQTARVRSPKGDVVGTLELTKPEIAGTPDKEATPRFAGIVRDAAGRERLHLAEERVTPSAFRAKLTHPESGDDVGFVEDRLTGGKVRAHVEVDLAMSRVMAWALAAIFADLARLRRKGWPEAAAVDEETVEPINEALGPRRGKG